VLWHGVLALAFEGWTAPLLQLKEQLNERAVAEWGLRAENSGSTWPKVSLGCLREERTLTLEQLRALMQLMRRYEAAIAAHAWRLRVRMLSAVVYSCRSLECLLMKQELPLSAKSNSSEPSHSVADESPAVARSAARVSGVLAELSEATAELYLLEVNKPGGRLEHYVTGAYKDSTLVAFLTTNADEESDAAGESTAADYNGAAFLPSFLRDFQRDVDQLLPGYYHFFAPGSLHCTIRAL